MSTKTSSSASVVAGLQEQLAALQRQIAELTSASVSHASKITPEIVGRFTIGNWAALQAAMMVDGTSDEFGRVKGKLRTDRKGYALVKKADTPEGKRLYMAVKGFRMTLISRKEKGLPVELSATPNDKGRSQVLYAQEVIADLVKAGWISSNSPILAGSEPKARKSAKRS